MRFAFAGIDFLIEPFVTFTNAGWIPVKLFTRPCDGVLDFNERAIAIAQEKRIPIQMSRIDPARDLAGLDCDVLVVSGYPWLIKGWEGHVTYAFNFHPSPLPEGRGPYPLYNAILDNWREWGVTAHKLAPAFDTGDIIDQERFFVAEDETHETLLSKCQMGLKRMSERLVHNLPQKWEEAQSQGEGSYFIRSTDDTRTIDWTKSVADIMRLFRAFGFVEVIAPLGGSMIHVRKMAGWVESHSHEPGAIVHNYRRSFVIAARDGYVQLSEWSPIALNNARNIGR